MYKRQVLSLVSEMLKAIAEYAKHDRVEFVRVVQEAQSSQPVSYTHLDVYKRQTVDRLGWVCYLLTAIHSH